MMRGAMLLVGAMAVAMVGCGGPLKYNLASSPTAPGADAKIVADVNEDQNQTQLEVEVVNLAPPSRVKEGTTAYTAWYRRSSSTPWARIGGLTYDEGSREGKVVGSVPERAFDFAITAEASDGPVSPSTAVVFSQRVADD